MKWMSIKEIKYKKEHLVWEKLTTKREKRDWTITENPANNIVYRLKIHLDALEKEENLQDLYCL